MIRKHRRNFLPAFIVNILVWIFLAVIILQTSPNHLFQFTIYNLQFTIPINIILFFITLTLALTLTCGFLFSNTRRGFFLAVFVNIILFLRLIKQAHWLNLVLLSTILVSLEVFFSRRD